MAMATYGVQGKVISKVTGLGASFAQVEIFEIDKIGPVYKSDLIAATMTNQDGEFSTTFTFSHGGPGSPARPDIIFRVTQNIDGVSNIIYNENPAEDTRWNIPDVLGVELKAEDCIAVSLPTGGAPYDNLFVFTRVGIIPISDIDLTDGYAYPDVDPADPNSLNANAPFGSSLDICGWFGVFTGVEYYKIKYTNGGGGPVEISDPLYNLRYDAVLKKFVSEKMGPQTIGGVNNLYALPTMGLPWVYPDRLIRWDTTKVQDGLYTLEIEGYNESAGVVTQINPPTLEIEPTYGILRLQVDNTPPTVYEIGKIKHDTDEKDVCDIIMFDSGTISIEFEASDANGHLRSYSLNALYGHDQYVTPPPTSPDKAVDNYSAHIDATKKWNGGTYTIEYPNSFYDATKMPKCAYQFRLGVSKRTTNGYGLVYHYREDTKHITIDRP
jgi:hypothetical protein